MDESDLVYRLRKRAEIRRTINTRKSVQEGKEDRLSLLLEEAADEIERLREQHNRTVRECVGVIKRRYMGDNNREDMEVRRVLEDIKEHFGIKE